MYVFHSKRAEKDNSESFDNGEDNGVNNEVTTVSTSFEMKSRYM